MATYTFGRAFENGTLYVVLNLNGGVCKRIEFSNFSEELAEKWKAEMEAFGHTPSTRPQLDINKMCPSPTEIVEAIGKLDNPKQRQVAICRFLNGMKLEHIGKVMGMSREKVRQTEAKVLRKLKAIL